ncbi:MAG: hypothetical protein J6584_08235 [Lactobacillus sp.]|nr:hypothetical protein [Lactobacillus sp.]
MKNKKVYLMSLFAFFIFLLMVTITNNAQASAQSQTITPLTTTSVPNLQANAAKKMNNFSMTTMPAANRIVRATDNPYDSPDHDLDLVEDGNGGYEADVYTAKGLFEAVWDPASPTWDFNRNNPDNWKDLFSKGILGEDANLHLGGSYKANVYLPISNIHKIVLMNNIDLSKIDDLTAKNYRMNYQLPANNIGRGNEINSKTSYKYVAIRHDNLLIDGKNQYIVMGFNNFALIGHNWAAKEDKTVTYPDGTSGLQPYKEDWTIENLDIYGTTYWGFISCNTGIAKNRVAIKMKEPIKQPGDVGYNSDKNDPTSDYNRANNLDDYKKGLAGGYSWITYDNVHYVGSQFSWTGGGTSGVTILGDTSGKSVRSFRAPDSDFIWLSESNNLPIDSNNNAAVPHGGNDQQNFEVDQVEFGKDCNYTGTTYNGNTLELTGSAVFRDGAKVDLYPHGTDTAEHHDGGMAYGISMPSGKPTINMYGSAQLNIHCNGLDPNEVPSSDDGHIFDAILPCGGIYMGSTNSELQFHKSPDSNDSPTINIDSEGKIFHNYPLIKMMGGIANLSHGTFHVKANKLGDYTNSTNATDGGLMSVGSGMKINVKTGGDFSISIGDKDNNPKSIIHLLYASDKMDVSIMNPKNVTLDLRKHQGANNALVYINSGDANASGADINAYDTRISAFGDNKQQTTLGNPGVASSDPNYGKVVSLGMGETVSSSNPAGTTTPLPVRVQRLVLPFSRGAITANLYLNGSKIIQAPDNPPNDLELKTLKAAMEDMQGKEFSYIRLSDLPGPSLTETSNSVYPIANRTISGTVGGKAWQVADNEDPSDPIFKPDPPLVQVQVVRKDGSIIDLGTKTNKESAKQKATTDPNDIAVYPVTPNLLIDNEGNLDVSNTDNLGKPVIDSQDNPKYLQDNEIKWTPQGQGQYTFKYDLDTLVDQYNQNLKAGQLPLHLKSSDQIKTSAVTNYQSSPITTTKVVNLVMTADKAPDYLLGDTIHVPIHYHDGDVDAKTITITGKIDGQPIPDATIDNIKHDTDTSYDWTIDKQTQTAGEHSLVFSGIDDQTNKIEKDIIWNYKVLNLPAYQGVKKVSGVNGDNILGGMQHVTTTFTPKANAPVHHIKISHDNSQDIGAIEKYSGSTIVAAYKDANGKVVKSKPIEFTLDKEYAPTDFGFSGNDFLAGTIFIVNNKVEITAGKNNPVKIGNNIITSIAADQTHKDLGQSNDLSYNMIGIIKLDVPGQIDYGSHHLPKQGKLTIKKLTNNLKITNDTTKEHAVKLTASVSAPDSNNAIARFLRYQDGSGNEHLLDNNYLIYQNSNLSADAHGVNISQQWFDKNKQVQGPILDLDLPQTPTIMRKPYNADITWSLVFGP